MRRAVVGTPVIQRTVRNQLLQGQLRARSPVEFCLGASDGCVLVRRRPGGRLQPNYLQRRHTGFTPGVMIWGAISNGSRSTLVIPNTLTANLCVKRVVTHYPVEIWLWPSPERKEGQLAPNLGDVALAV
ncbi:HTH_Tnp_Tc3_2 domain-containing protein [Trichonephila clavipes]|nr:HTH_Tnp_Tc3_2 domain-containing protein [Trichonephila clavipes]